MGMRWKTFVSVPSHEQMFTKSRHPFLWEGSKGLFLPLSLVALPFLCAVAHRVRRILPEASGFSRPCGSAGETSISSLVA